MSERNHPTNTNTRSLRGAAVAAALLLALLVSLATMQSVSAQAASQGQAASAGASGAPDPSDTEAAREWAALVQRGAYLANHVSMCVECHSPRDREGDLRGDRLFTGGPMPVTNPFAGARWAFTAPNLRRVPGYTQDEFIHFMASGETPNGTEARGPMPQFRMQPRDARALWAYLYSL